MATILEGDARGTGRRVAVAVAEFNRDVTGALLDGCLRTLQGAGVRPEDVTVAWVPGAFELPLACDALADAGSYDAIIALGAVIRGETPHFEYVAGECARGIAQISLHRGLPVIFGVLTTDTLEQARRRADPQALVGSDTGGAPRASKSANVSNKGAEAAVAALRMASLLEKI